jgi:hypothetical protein
MKRSFLIAMLSGLVLINTPVLALNQQPNQQKTPQSEQSVSPATTEQNPTKSGTAEASDPAARGRAMLLAARRAIGEEALKKLQDIVFKSESTLAMFEDNGAIINEITIKLPNKMLSRTSSGFGDILQSYNGQTAWHKTARGLEEFSGNTLNEFRKAMANETIFLITQFEQPGFQIEFQKEVTISERRANLLLIKLPFEHEVSLYVDAENGAILRKTYRSAGAGMKFDHEENYSDFREVGGLRLPFKRSRLRNGQPFLETVITEVKINTGATDQSFDKPVKSSASKN